MSKLALALALAAMLMASGSASAQMSVPEPEHRACAVTDAALPPLWSAWAKPVAFAAEGTMETGKAYKVFLSPSAKITYAVPLRKPAAAGTFAGLLTLTIAKSGTYSVALDQAAWIDVSDGPAVVSSVAHSHGPDCSNVHKIVDFALMPGTYVVQVSGAARPQAIIEVIAKP